MQDTNNDHSQSITHLLKQRTGLKRSLARIYCIQYIVCSILCDVLLLRLNKQCFINSLHLSLRHTILQRTNLTIYRFISWGFAFVFKRDASPPKCDRVNRLCPHKISYTHTVRRIRTKTSIGKKSIFSKINHNIHSGQQTQTEFIGP